MLAELTVSVVAVCGLCALWYRRTRITHAVDDEQPMSIDELERAIAQARWRVTEYSILLEHAPQELLPESSLPCTMAEMKSALLFHLSVEWSAGDRAEHREQSHREAYGALSRFVSAELAAASGRLLTARAISENPEFKNNPDLVRAVTRNYAEASKAGALDPRFVERSQLTKEFDAKWALLKLEAERATAAA